MKRFALILTAVAALAIFSTSSANAADSFYGYAGHGFVGSYGYGSYVGQGGYGHGGYRHGGLVRSYGRRVHHGYAAPAYGGHGYNRSYGRGGGLRISTPHFGLRLGH